MRKIIFLVILQFLSYSTLGQNSSPMDSIVSDTVKNIRFNYKQLIIPGVLIGYGFWGAESGQIKSFNFQIRDEFTEDIDKKVTIDDFQDMFLLFLFMLLMLLGSKEKIICATAQSF